MSPGAGTLAALGDIDIGQLLQYVVLFAIFILPGIKASREAKKRKQEHSRRTGPEPKAGGGPERTRPSGADLWEQLLRGEVEPAPPPPVPVPRAPKAKKPPAPKPQQRKPRAQPIDREPLFVPSADALASAEKKRSRSQPPALPKVASESVLEVGTGQLEGTLPLESGLDRAAARKFLQPAQAVPASVQSRRVPIALPMSRQGWRRAVVMAEVLGTPVSMRRAGGPGSVPGLS